MNRPFITNLSALLLTLVVTSVPAQTEVDETREMDADGRISLRAVTGQYQILGTDDNRLTVTGTLGADVEELKIGGDPDSWTLEVKHKDRSEFGRGKSGRTELVITLPRGAELEARSVSGNLELVDLSGDSVNVQSISGEIDLTGVSPRRLEVESVSGSQRMNTAGSEETRLKSVSGSIEAGNASGRVRAKSVSGNITLDADAVVEAELETVSGHIRAALMPAEQARIDASSHSGSMRLALPAGTGLDLRAKTFSGRIQSAFGGEVQRGRGPGEQLEHRAGNGQVRAELKSFSGGIEIAELE